MKEGRKGGREGKQDERSKKGRSKIFRYERKKGKKEGKKKD